MSIWPSRPWAIVVPVIVVLVGAAEDVAGQASAVTPTPMVPTIETRIMESPGRLLQAPSGTLSLGSFHLDMRIEEPRFDAAARRVATREWRLRADLQKDDVFFIARSATDHVEGWILNQSRRPEPYEKVADTPRRSPRVLNIWGLSRAWSVALSVAAPGWTAAGQERIEGRSAEKYLVDSARVPAAKRELLRHWNIPVSKGTVWVDVDTGALLKASLEYRQDFTSPDQRGTGKTLASANARVQLRVTKIGRVTVNAPKAETSMPEQRLALTRRLLAEVERSPSAYLPELRARLRQARAAVDDVLGEHPQHPEAVGLLNRIDALLMQLAAGPRPHHPIEAEAHDQGRAALFVLIGTKVFLERLTRSGRL